MFKKIIILMFCIILFSSCSECTTKECLEYKLEQDKIRLEQQEKIRQYELEKLKIQAEIEANKPIEVKVQEIQSATQQEANDSLKYLETSQQVRDVIDVASFWYWIFKILTE